MGNKLVGAENMRIALIGTIIIGLTACSSNSEPATDEEVLIASCMDDSHMSKQALKLFGPINIEWCNCQLEVIQDTISPETYKQIATSIRSGDTPHFMNAASLISRKADDEASAAMKAWVPICKPLR